MPPALFPRAAWDGLAQLSGGDGAKALLAGATLIGADLSNAKGLTQDQVDEACAGAGTRLPRGIVARGCNGARMIYRQQWSQPDMKMVPAMPAMPAARYVVITGR